MVPARRCAFRGSSTSLPRPAFLARWAVRRADSPSGGIPEFGAAPPPCGPSSGPGGGSFGPPVSAAPGCAPSSGPMLPSGLPAAASASARALAALASSSSVSPIVGFLIASPSTSAAPRPAPKARPMPAPWPPARSIAPAFNWSLSPSSWTASPAAEIPPKVVASPAARPIMRAASVAFSPRLAACAMRPAAAAAPRSPPASSSGFSPVCWTICPKARLGFAIADFPKSTRPCGICFQYSASLICGPASETAPCCCSASLSGMRPLRLAITPDSALRPGTASIVCATMPSGWRCAYRSTEASGFSWNILAPLISSAKSV